MNLVRKDEKKMGEKEYRAIPLLSYSALRTYVQNRQLFIKKFVQGEKVVEDESASAVIGSMVHSLMAGDQEEFDSKYVLTQQKRPVGQVGELCDELYKRSLRSVNEQGVQTDSFPVMLQDAVDKLNWGKKEDQKKFKGKDLEAITKLFTTTDKEGGNGEAFYGELLKNTGKTTVEVHQIAQAEKVCEMLKSHSYTADIVNTVSDNYRYEVYNELPIIFEIHGIQYKGMIDKIIVDHVNKDVWVYDYKVSWEAETFSYSYIKNCYWLQVGMYSWAVGTWMKERGLDKDYIQQDMTYIVIDPTCNIAPHIYQVSQEDTLKACTGFNLRGKHYMGIHEVLESIAWSQETGNWKSTKQLEENKGKCKLEIAYENN